MSTINSDIEVPSFRGGKQDTDCNGASHQTHEDLHPQILSPKSRWLQRLLRPCQVLNPTIPNLAITHGGLGTEANACSPSQPTWISFGLMMMTITFVEQT